MIRLLYLLMRQRLDSARPPSPDGVTGMQRSRRPALLAGLLALAFGVAAVAAVGEWRARQAARADAPARPLAGTASLRVRVAGVASPPLLVFLDAPGAAGPTTAEVLPPTVQLTTVGGVFEPAFQVAPLAARVEVDNADPIPHNTHVFAGRRTLFNVALPLQGVPVTQVLRRTGLFDVRCDLHVWMRAAVFVPPNPHYAVIRQAGDVVLRNIAPGRWRLHVWAPGQEDRVSTIELLPTATHTLELPGG